MIKQRLLGIALVTVGWLSAPIADDATFAIVATIIGASLIFTNKQIID